MTPTHLLTHVEPARPDPKPSFCPIPNRTQTVPNPRADPAVALACSHQNLMEVVSFPSKPEGTARGIRPRPPPRHTRRPRPQVARVRRPTRLRRRPMDLR